MSDGLDTYGHAALLSGRPLVFHLIPAVNAPLGIAPLLGQELADRPVEFLIHLTRTCETPELAGRVARAIRAYLDRQPNHRLTLLCNTPAEAEALTAAGVGCVFCNHNILASEETFHPIERSPVEFEAVYNARLTRLKRHELAAEIGRVLYLCHNTLPDQKVIALARQIGQEILRHAPGHVIANPLKDGIPVWIPLTEVNRHLARASVGLCLSEAEGPMFASVEYLLAGLPIVSTPSKGGRDVYFDPDYCLIADPDPRAVREAVEALRKRQIPRDYVRRRTLAKLEPDRLRFLALMESIAERHRIPRRFRTFWPYATRSGPQQWKTVREHLADIPDLAPARSAGGR